MSQMLLWMNLMSGLILFFSMAGISSRIVFASPGARVFPFLLGILLLCNAAYLALARGESWTRRT